jgi:hypothetical protein
MHTEELAMGISTVAICMRVECSDPLRVTNHCDALIVDGEVYLPDSSVVFGSIANKVGLGSTRVSVSMVGRIGDIEGAMVSIFMVDYTAPAPVPLKRGVVRSITVHDQILTIDVASIAHLANTRLVGRYAGRVLAS